MVAFSGKQIGLLGDRLDRAGHLGHLRECGSDITRRSSMRRRPRSIRRYAGPRSLPRCALRDFHRRQPTWRIATARERGRDTRLAETIVSAVFLKMPEPLGLAGYPAGDLLQISGDVRELNPKAADRFAS